MAHRDMSPAPVIALVSFMLGAFAACTKGALSESPGRSATVHYIRFSLSTFVAVTPETIETQAHEHLVLAKGADQLRTIEEALSETQPGHFDPELVRAKIVVPGREAVLVDKQGGVRGPQGDRSLTKSGFQKLKAALQGLSRKDY